MLYRDFNASPLSLFIPYCDSIGLFMDYVSIAWNMDAHICRVYLYVEIPLKPGAFSEFDVPKLVWKKACSGRRGVDWDMTTQSLYFSPGSSYPNTLNRVWDAVVH